MSTDKSRVADSSATDSPPSENSVFLRGRLAAAPEIRELPSGDTMTTFRVTVDRKPPGRVRVDSLDCATVRAKVRRVLERAEPGDQLEVHGSLQRRFWRGPAGPTSRYTVDVESARLIRARRRAGGSAARTPASG